MTGDFAWSPDGKTLAVVNSNSSQEPRSIFLLSLETGEKRRLTAPQMGSFGDTRAYGNPTVSSDGRWILYWQVDQIDNDIMLVEGFH